MPHSVYYNDNDKFSVQWLKNLSASGLIDRGFIDSRSIKDIKPDDLREYSQCHFFAGVGGWSYALQLAGWPRNIPVWTGSCPCQPFSSAGKRGGEKDERHLWPEFYRLISEYRPGVIFGEQVASKDGLEWIDGVSLDLEELGYAVTAVDMPAAGVQAPHIRQRLWWVAQSPCERRRSHELESESGRRQCAVGSDDGDVAAGAFGVAHRVGNSEYERLEGTAISGLEQPEVSAKRCEPRGVFHPTSDRRQQRRPESEWRQSSARCSDVGVAQPRGDTDQQGPQGRSLSGSECSDQRSPWAASHVVACTDGTQRRVGAGVQPLAYGIPKGLGRGKSELSRMGRSSGHNRVGRLRGYGNAIVPELAAVFIRSFMEIVGLCD